MRNRATRDVTKFGRALDHLVSQLPGALHLAQVPGCHCEMCSCDDPRVEAETELRLRVAVGLIVGQGPFQVGLGLQEFALVATGCAETTAGEASFRGVSALLGLPQKGLSHPLRSAMFAPREASHPLRKVGRKSFGGVFLPTGQFAGAGKGVLCFLRGEALGPHHRLAVGRLKMKPALSLPLCGLDLLRLRQRRQQRLRLGDLRHFGRRREAFERRREDGVGVGGAAGRLVELGERKRGAQFEAARALLLRDRDGGQEGFFRRRGVGGVALEQDFAARPMQFRFERAIAGAVGRRQRFVEDRKGAVGIARPGFGLGQRDLQEPVEKQNVLFAQQLDAAAHVLEPARRARRSAAVAQPCEKHPERAPHGQIVLTREPGEFEGVRRGARMVATHQFEQGRVHSSKRERADMREVRRSASACGR